VTSGVWSPPQTADGTFSQVAFFIKWHFLSSGIFYQVAFFIKWHYSCTINHQPDSLAKELCLTPCYPPPTAMTVRSPPRAPFAGPGQPTSFPLYDLYYGLPRDCKGYLPIEPKAQPPIWGQCCAGCPAVLKVPTVIVQGSIP